MWKKFEMSTQKTEYLGVPRSLVQLQGYFDSSTMNKFKEYIDSYSKDDPHVIVSFNNADYVSAVAMGLMMALQRELKERKGQFYLVNMPEKIERTFTMLG